jgi:hypothetical protein
METVSISTACQPVGELAAACMAKRLDVEMYGSTFCGAIDSLAGKLTPKSTATTAK